MRKKYVILPFIIAIIMPLLFLVINCGNEPVGSDPQNEIYGTWKEYHIKRYDSVGVLIQESDVTDSVWFSVFPSGMAQAASILPGLKFLIFKRYTYDKPYFSKYPDSLMDSLGEIHYWNSSDSTFTPPYGVKTYPITPEMAIIGKDTLIETRTFPTQKLVVYWARQHDNPIDLKSKILNHRQNNNTNQENASLLKYDENEYFFVK